VLTLTVHSTVVTKCIACFKHSTTNAVRNKGQPVILVGEQTLFTAGIKRNAYIRYVDTLQGFLSVNQGLHIFFAMWLSTAGRPFRYFLKKYHCTQF